MNNTTPLVSVGIPTFNRPEGLRRTLELISNQSFKELEIIISDNCSSNPEVEKIANLFVKADSRIKYIRQKENIGISNNFLFVLSSASCPYFMWAADDDEWHPDFIKSCMSNISGASSIMTGFDVLNRVTGARIISQLPPLLKTNSNFLNCNIFLGNMQPSLFYGIHKRDSIQFIFEQDLFDWADCYCIAKLILSGQGFHTIPEILYTAGIDTPEYIKKPFNPQPGRVFEHDPFLIDMLFLIASREELKIEETLELLKIVVMCIMKWQPVILETCAKNILNTFRLSAKQS
jgi:glycosyltransferase involved in cell wall biosynthesis